MSNRQATSAIQKNFTTHATNKILMDTGDEGSFPRAFIPHEAGTLHYKDTAGTTIILPVLASLEYSIQISVFLPASVGVITITGLQ